MIIFDGNLCPFDLFDKFLNVLTFERHRSIKQQVDYDTDAPRIAFKHTRFII